MNTKNVCYPQDGYMSIMYSDDLFSGVTNTPSLSNISMGPFSFTIKLSNINIDEVEIIFVKTLNELKDNYIYIGFVKVRTNFKKELEFGDVGPVETYVSYNLTPSEYTTIELWCSKSSEKLFVKVDSL